MRRKSRSGPPVWRRGFPFFLGEPRTAIERLRAATARELWTQGPVWKRLLLGGVMTVGWPSVTLMDSIRLRVKGDPGVPGFTKLYWTALTRSLPPNQHALYASLPALAGADIADVLLPLDFRGLHVLNRRRGARVDDVQDKRRFERVCRAHGLACVPTIATFRQGASTGVEELRRWTQPFFVKALTGNRGAGSEKWVPGQKGFSSGDGRELTIEAVIEKLRPTNSIVQPVIEDCAELRARGSVALSSLRVITARGVSTTATPIAALLSLATGAGSLTSHAGLACGIDIERGTIVAVRAVAEDGSRPAIDTASDLIGVTLPSWRDTLDLVCRAHDEAFPEFVTLGWDVALTPSGPVLLETNVGWNMTQHQVLTGPLGSTRLADVIDELLAPAEAGRCSANPR